MININAFHVFKNINIMAALFIVFSCYLVNYYIIMKEYKWGLVFQ